MVRLALAALLFAACTDEPDLDPTSPELHELTPCEGWGTGTTMCEAPCAEFDASHGESAANGDGCTASFVVEGLTYGGQCSSGGAGAPDSHFRYGGVRGCCMRVPASRYVGFAVCDPQ